MGLVCWSALHTEGRLDCRHLQQQMAHVMAAPLCVSATCGSRVVHGLQGRSLPLACSTPAAARSTTIAACMPVQWKAEAPQPKAHVHPANLMRNIKRTRTAGQLLRLVQQSGPSFNTMHISAALMHLVHLQETDQAQPGPSGQQTAQASALGFDGSHSISHTAAWTSAASQGSSTSSAGSSMGSHLDPLDFIMQAMSEEAWQGAHAVEDSHDQQGSSGQPPPGYVEAPLMHAAMPSSNSSSHNGKGNGSTAPAQHPQHAVMQALLGQMASRNQQPGPGGSSSPQPQAQGSTVSVVDPIWESMDACGLAHTVYAMGRLQYFDTVLLRQLLEALRPRLAECTAVQLACLVTGLALLQARPDRAWRAAFYDAVALRMWGGASGGVALPQAGAAAAAGPGAQGRGAGGGSSGNSSSSSAPAAAAVDVGTAANLLFGMSRLGMRPPCKWMGMLLAHAAPPDALLAHAGHHGVNQASGPADAGHSWSAGAGHKGPPLQPGTLSCLVYSLGRLGYCPVASWWEALLAVTQHQLTHRPKSGSKLRWQPRELACLLWGVMRLGVPVHEHKAWLQAVLKASMGRAEQARPHEVTMMAHAMGMLGQQLHAHAVPQKGQQSQTLSQGQGQSQVQPRSVSAAAAPPISQRQVLQQQPSSKLQDALLRQKPKPQQGGQQGAGVAAAPASASPAAEPEPEPEAAAGSQSDTQSLLRGARRVLGTYLSQVYGHLPSLQPRELVLLLYSCVVAQLRPDDGWLSAVLAELSTRMSSGVLSALDCSQLAYCVARLRVRPEGEWVGLLMQQSARYFPSYSPAQLANLAWGLGSLGAQPPLAWLCDLCEAVSMHLPTAQPSELRQLGYGVAQMASNSNMLQVLGRAGHGRVLRALAQATSGFTGATPELLQEAVAAAAASEAAAAEAAAAAAMAVAKAAGKKKLGLEAAKKKSSATKSKVQGKHA